MRPDMKERLRAAIERKNAERGRPLTAREKMESLRRWLWRDGLPLTPPIKDEPNP